MAERGGGTARGEAGAAPAPGAKGPIQVVEFVLGDEHFAIDLFDVREVVENTTITRLPNVPEYIRGIIDLRGEITTIIDLKERLNIPRPDSRPAESARIIVLDEKIARAKIGILVDDVTSVSTFDPDQVDSTGASVSREESTILGILKRKVRVRDRETSELIIWIDIRKLIADIDAHKSPDSTDAVKKEII